MKAGIDYIGVAVGVFIINKKNQIFLTKRGQQATNERGTWEIPGGKVNFGETLQFAAKREIKEEFGIDVNLIEQFPAQNHLIPEESQHWVPTTFLAKVKGTKRPKIIEPNKCEAIGWFAFNKLPKPLSIITKIDINQYKKRLKK